ncbi:MAG: hypothetical protein COA36_16665 [Desulfotalea sp.]|nr:MAG: hypothetical protein COA36_16665 [Desulfotalea sp.]
MENPNTNTKVKHSESKNAWNIVAEGLGVKYKIARVPYLVIEDCEIMNEIEKSIALKHANYISYCFNNSSKILQN